MKKLVIFDCDGVLVDSETLANQAFVDELAAHAIPFTLAKALEKFKGQKLTFCINHAEEISGKKLPLDFEIRFRAKMDGYFQEKLHAIHGIEEALKTIAYPICVASNGPQRKIERSLEITGLAKYFGENIFSAYTIQKWKPLPDLFLHACREMGGSPSQTIVVEDSVPGIEAALSAGMRTLAFGREQEFTKLGVVRSFSEMESLPSLIDSVFSSQ